MTGDHHDETEENNLQEKLIMQVENISFSFLKDAVDDEIYNLIKPGKICGKLAREVLSKKQSENTKELSRHIFERLHQTLFKLLLSTSNDPEKMHQKVYNLAINVKPMSTSRAIRAILSVIEFLCVDPTSSSKTFLQDTKEWTEKINRGGLINVTDEFYVFIRHVEMSARNILNTNLMKKYGGENMQNLLMSEFNKNNLIDLCWSSITSRMGKETLKNTLKSEVLKKCVNIRGNAFVRAWVDTVKKRPV